MENAQIELSSLRWLSDWSGYSRQVLSNLIVE